MADEEKQSGPIGDEKKQSGPIGDEKKQLGPIDEEEKRSSDCLAAWGFLTLSIGIISLVPGCVLAGVYMTDSSVSSGFIAAVTVFTTGMVLTCIGTIITVKWCYRIRQAEKDEKLFTPTPRAKEIVEEKMTITDLETTPNSK